MSFILQPRYGDEVQINAWNWRPTIEILRTEKLIDDQTAELLGCNGCGAAVDESLAGKIAAALASKLATLQQGERVRADLTIATEPKLPVVFHPGMNASEIDVIDLYSASYDWLVRFRDFCERSGGFKVL